MSNRNKRKLDEDPTKSDPEDLDYGEEASPKPRAHARSRKSNKSASRKPTKRRRETYGSDDEISLDDDEISDDDEFDHSSRDEAASIERNPHTGRAVRRSAAKREVNYEEHSDDEAIEDTDDEDSRPVSSRNKHAAPETKKESLVIKLKVPKSHTGRPRPGSRGGKREPTPQAQSAAGTRRSSRISHDDQQPLVALTDSGRNEVVMRAGTATPEPQLPRPTRGSKGLRSAPQNLPSAILEASQEDSQRASRSTEDQDYISQLQAAATQGATDMVGIADTQPEEELDDQIRMEIEGGDLAEESAGDENDEDEGPVSRGAGRSLRRRKASTPPLTEESPQKSRRSLRKRKLGVEQSSDFEPDAEGEGDVDEDLSDSEGAAKGRDPSSNGDSNNGRRSGRFGRKTASQRSRSARQPSEDELDPDEIADEAAELDEDNRRNRRSRKPRAAETTIAFETTSLRRRGNKPDYRIFRPEVYLAQDDDDAPAITTTTPSKARRGGGGGAFHRSLFSTLGPFGGAGGPPPVFGGEAGGAATGGVDSDSSDDEGNALGGQQGLGGTVGMTPTSAFPKAFLPPQLNPEPLQGPGGGPPGLGKIKDRKALADADPLGVDPNVSFESVGGLDDQIDRLKEMVALPLLYPELFQRFHVTPPRGVLFHGPPGTGKTLLARALASSVSSQGKKVTFYMRKGADALSKWVGEAEKQLRLLFEEARKNQPSIIFFDEIDGLAPVRSSKQEQIHASIVATLLALMDGMDGRGQVIVIGATNRPDSVDPALRRPGRFDREFYFSLPDQIARRSIIDIHTKGWEPPLQPEFKDQLAEITRGYAGADLRALCTEAALNAVQGTFPQIYSSNQKLLIDPAEIKVLAKDFMISVNKIVPSSERSASTGAVALKKDVEPLLRKHLMDLTNIIDRAIPRKRKITALEEAMYDDRDDEMGFEREKMQRQFESARVFRPRLLIKGREGMGQYYLGAALLSKLEGLHVQNFDMPTLMKDSTRSIEAAIVQQFEEVKRHKPSVIYIPNVDLWYHTIGESAVKTFTGLLRTLPPTEPVLLLGVMDREVSEVDEKDGQMLRDLFGYSLKNQYHLERPESLARHEYWKPVIDLIKTAPSDFPEPENRKKRKLAVLPVAPAEEVPSGPSKAELKAQKKKDRQTLNYLKIHLQSVMDQIKLKYKKFRTPAVDEAVIGYLYDEQDPEVFTTDLTEEQRREQQIHRPYELDKDEKGIQGLREMATGKFYYNMEIITIEKRLSNGYYKRPYDFLADIKRMAKDAKTLGDEERTIKANELLSNVEVDVGSMETQQPALVAECEAVYQREQARARIQMTEQGVGDGPGRSQAPLLPPPGSKTTTETSGPITLGQQVPGRALFPLTPHPTASEPNVHFLGQDVSPKSYSGSLTNGSHHTNGSTVPSKPQEDIEMSDSQPVDGKPVSQADSHGWPNTQGERSQTSAHTRLAQGSQIDQYHNSASTTTSGQKTSDKSRSSGLNTQASNGVRPMDGPDWSDIPLAAGGSQLPDTQDPTVEPSLSQSQLSQASQPMAPPAAPAQRQSVHALLNEPDETSDVGNDRQAASRILIELGDCQMLHDELTKNSSGMSVEQLEQINASLMDVIWRQRGEWNRNKVIHEVQMAFNDTVADIEQCQNILNPSQQK